MHHALIHNDKCIHPHSALLFGENWIIFVAANERFASKMIFLWSQFYGFKGQQVSDPLASTPLFSKQGDYLHNKGFDAAVNNAFA